MAVGIPTAFGTTTPLPPAPPGGVAKVLDVGADRVVRHRDRIGIRGAIDRLLVVQAVTRDASGRAVASVDVERKRRNEVREVHLD